MTDLRSRGNASPRIWVGGRQYSCPPRITPDLCYVIRRLITVYVLVRRVK